MEWPMAELRLAKEALSSSSETSTLTRLGDDADDLAAFDVKDRAAAVAVVDRIVEFDPIRPDAQHFSVGVQHDLAAFAVAGGDHFVARLHGAADVGGEREVAVISVLDRQSSPGRDRSRPYRRES